MDKEEGWPDHLDISGMTISKHRDEGQSEESSVSGEPEDLEYLEGIDQAYELSDEGNEDKDTQNWSSGIIDFSNLDNLHDIAPEYINSTINGSFLRTLEKVNNRLITNVDKIQEEIGRFEDLLKGFGSWVTKYEENNKIVRPRNGTVGYDFVVHGHRVNKFLFNFSKININMIVERKEDREKALETLANYLHEKTENKAYIQEFIHHKKIPKRKIVFQFFDGKTDFIIKVNIQHLDTLTLLITRYADHNETFFQMGTFLTFWANKRGLLYNLISPQVLYVMIIYFLMSQKPAIIPTLHNPTIKKKVFTLNRKTPLNGNPNGPTKVQVDYRYEEEPDVIATKMKQFKNTRKVGELILSFFHAFSQEFKDKRISIKDGSCNQRPKEGYSIADPFIEDVDLCYHLSKGDDRYQKVHNEFMRAYQCMIDNKINELCLEPNSVSS